MSLLVMRPVWGCFPMGGVADDFTDEAVVVGSEENEKET